MEKQEDVKEKILKAMRRIEEMIQEFEKEDEDNDDNDDDSDDDDEDDDDNEDDGCYEIDSDDNSDECCEIGAADFSRKISLNVSEDVVLVAEKGSVALKDFPHPRHLCGNFPFATTSHESYCSKCFCCLCEVAAPCPQWKGANGHCNLSK